MAGIEQATTWSDSETNNMILNNDKAVILNVAFSDCKGINDPIPFHCGDIVPSRSANFLGVTFFSNLAFSQHVSQLLSKE